MAHRRRWRFGAGVANYSRHGPGHPLCALDPPTPPDSFLSAGRWRSPAILSPPARFATKRSSLRPRTPEEPAITSSFVRASAGTSLQWIVSFFQSFRRYVHHGCLAPRVPRLKRCNQCNYVYQYKIVSSAHSFIHFPSLQYGSLWDYIRTHRLSLFAPLCMFSTVLILGAVVSGVLTIRRPTPLSIAEKGERRSGL